MLKHMVFADLPNGRRLKIAECETRELAEMVAAAIKAYKPAPVQEEASNHIMTETFRLTPDAVEVVEKAEVKA